MLYRSAYTSIEDMPLRNFVKTVTTNDLTWLLSDNKWYLPKPDLKSNWETVFNEYIERMKDPKSQRVFQLVRDITITANYINIANQAIQLLYASTDENDFKEVKKTLNAILMTRCKFNNDSLLKDIKICVSAIKRLVIRHRELSEEYHGLQVSEAEKVSETDFTQQIVSLEKIHGISIDYRKISVSKYISYIEEAKKDQQNG